MTIGLLVPKVVATSLNTTVEFAARLNTGMTTTVPPLGQDGAGLPLSGI